jgi:hypothetical protein
VLPDPVEVEGVRKANDAIGNLIKPLLETGPHLFPDKTECGDDRRPSALHGPNFLKGGAVQKSRLVFDVLQNIFQFVATENHGQQFIHPFASTDLFRDFGPKLLRHFCETI